MSTAILVRTALPLIVVVIDIGTEALGWPGLDPSLIHRRSLNH